MSISTYTEYQAQPASEKILLAKVEASRRLVGWTLYSGSVYSFSISETVLESVEQDGTALTLATSTSLSASQYYYDRALATLYVRTSDGTSPDSKFLAITYWYFFANVPVALPHDLASGYEVEWQSMLEDSSKFVVEIENTKSLLGVALSNSSTIKFFNDQDFWRPIYDKVTFESHSVNIYSWNRSLPVSEASIVYKGKTFNRSYAADFVTFELKDFLDELRAPIAASLVSDYVGARVSDNLLTARQRVIYGAVKGHIPTPIDQVLDVGYPLTGTLTVVVSSTAVSGSGTQFLKELSPGDELFIGDATEKVKIDSVTTDTALVLSAPFAQPSQTAQAATVVPTHAKRYANRDYLVAGHALARPAYTVTEVIDNSQFYLLSTDGLMEGDVLEFENSQGEIRILGDGFVKLVRVLNDSPAPGDTMYLAAVSKVYLDGIPLNFGSDYDYDSATAILTLSETAEFNQAVVALVTGTITVSNGSRSITGTTTQFRTELAIGDWIKLSSKDTYFEILDVVDDLTLTVRTTPSAADAGSGAAYFKHPFVYDRTSVISCDALGKMDSDGNFIRTAGRVARDLLAEAGLEDHLNETSFTDSDELLPYRVGFALPARFSDRNVPSLRDTLNKLCRSIFASVILNNNFQLEMSVLEPSWTDDPDVFDESDMLKFNVESDSSNIVKTARVNYLAKEYDGASRASSASVQTSQNSRLLSTTQKEFSIDTVLVDQEDAEIFASRWAFLLDIASSDIIFETGLKAARLQINDVIRIDHEKLYERIGSADRTRIGAVLSVAKGIGTIRVLVNDLGNAFARVGRISPDDALDFGAANAEDRVVNGYITDENGLTDTETYGINLIW